MKRNFQIATIPLPYSNHRFAIYILSFLLGSCTLLVGQSTQHEQSLSSNSKVIPALASFGCREAITNYLALMASSRQGGMLDDSFESITACYDQLHSVPPFSLSLPSQLQLSVFNTNRSNDSYYDQKAASTIDRFLYRLPNLGPYDCYYGISDSRTLNYGEYGHLLLMDSAGQTKLLINIYFEYGGDQNISLRYFAMEQGKLYLYEGYCYDDGCRLWKKAVIQITKKGALRIRMTRWR